MATRPDGNYYANLPDPIWAGFIDGRITHGSGVPGSSTLISSGYIDDSTGDFYVNTDGTVGGWVLVTGGSGGGSAITHGNGSPITGGVSVVTYKVYLQDDAPALWAVINGGWLQIA